LTGRALVFDTSYFVQLFYSKDAARTRLLKRLAQSSAPKWISVITLIEVQKISMEADGKEVADSRSSLMQQDFKVKAVDAEVATIAASLQASKGLSGPQSMIAATAITLAATCVTDDPALKKLGTPPSSWI
jgi:predicted nucleic acid-binding protein